MNLVVEMGRLGKDPEVRESASGVKVATYSLAVDNGKDKDGNRKTLWVDCVAFRGAADFAEKYLSRGKMIAVVGSLDKETYEKDGVKRTNTRVVVNNHFFCGEGKAADVPVDNVAAFFNIPDGVEDLPFE